MGRIGRVSEEKILSLQMILSEVTRADIKPKKDIFFVDPYNNLKTLSTQANHVVFGRRGSGKTLLLSQLFQEKQKKYLPVSIDCERWKELTYPNLLLKILIEIFSQIQDEYESSKPSIISLKKRKRKHQQSQLNNLQAELEKRLLEADEIKVDRHDVKTEKKLREFDVGLQSKITGKVSRKKAVSEKVSRQYPQHILKIEYLNNNVDKFSEIISRSAEVLQKECIFLLFDDFYYISIDDQFRISDFLHRVCKNTNIYYKLATIRHRTTLYQRKADSYIQGIQEGADFMPIDLDFSLEEDMDLMLDFLNDILDHYCQLTGIHYPDLFVDGDNGVGRLIWASGGVPRDLLHIFLQSLKIMKRDHKNRIHRIGKDQINEAAYVYCRRNKLAEFHTEFGDNEQLLSANNDLLAYVGYLKRKTGFIVKETKIPTEFHNTLNILQDLRLIHLYDKMFYSKTYHDNPYTAYILDIGQYSEILQRRGPIIKEFNILRHMDKSGDNELRSDAPPVTADIIVGMYDKYLHEIGIEQKVITEFS